MKEIFYELIKEASQGNIIIDGEEWPIGFNTIIYEDSKEKVSFIGNNLSLLRITNEEAFFNALEEYISLELEKNRRAIPFLDQTGHSHIKYLISYLFVNASTEEFTNPIPFIKRRIEFLQNDTFTYLNDGQRFNIGDFFLGSQMEVTNRENSISMETASRLDFTLVNRVEEKELRCPILSIYYGITEDNTCYIYSLMKPKEPKKNIDQNEEKFKKKINRLLYKLQDGVMENESEEFKAYKNGTSDYYPENITDVTSSFVLGLTAFMALLESAGINKIKVIPYLPVRYLSRSIAADNISDEEKRTELQERNNAIQYNATNKLIRTFRRVMYHLKDLELYSFPYELDECLNLTLSEEHTDLNNPLLNDIFNGLQDQEKTKKI